MDIEPFVSYRFVIYIHNYLLDIKENPQTLFENCDLNYPLSDEPEMNLPLFKVADLMEKAAKQCNDPNLGLHIAKRLHYESAGIMVLAMLAAPNVEEGIKTLCHYDRYIDSAIEISLEVAAKTSSFKLKLLNPRNVNTQQLTEFLLFLFVDMLNKGTRKDMPIVEICFNHSSS